MNLEKLNLVELNAQEVRKTEGGFWQIVLGVIAIGSALYGAGYAVGHAHAHYDNNNK